MAQHSSITKHGADRHEGLNGRRLKRVLSFIEDQLAEDLSLEKIAAVAGVSASHLQTLFQILMGMPVHQYVIQRRVERAKTLLMNDGLLMAEIALQLPALRTKAIWRGDMRRVLGTASAGDEAPAGRIFRSPLISRRLCFRVPERARQAKSTGNYIAGMKRRNFLEITSGMIAAVAFNPDGLGGLAKEQ